MRKKGLFLVLLLLVVSTLCIHAVAEEVQPLAVEEARVEAVVSFSNGQVISIGRAYNVPSELKAVILVFLQRQSGDSWVTIANNTGVDEAAASATAVAENTYRAYVICRLIDSTGSSVDVQHHYSLARTY